MLPDPNVVTGPLVVSCSFMIRTWRPTMGAVVVGVLIDQLRCGVSTT